MSDSSLAATALRLVTKHGRSGVSLLRPGAGAVADPAMPWKPNGAAADAVLASGFKAVFLDSVSVREDPTLLTREATTTPFVMTPGSTHLAIVAANSLGTVIPSAGDLVKDTTRQYSVLSSELIQPGDVPIVFLIQLKG
jgi:hypothetical protein